MPLITLDQAPLKKAFDPSSLMIFLQQSIVPVYMMSAVEIETELVIMHQTDRGPQLKVTTDAHLLCVQTASSCDV